MDTHTRTIAKALSWRVFATLTTSAVAWGITGKIEFAAAIGILDGLLKLGGYYLHERMWNRVRFGKSVSAGQNFAKQGGD